MAATVLVGYSNEQGQIQPPTYAPLRPNQREGRVRFAYFSKTFASEAAATNIGLTELPKGARIIDGEITVSATTSTATIAIGLMAKDGSGFIDTANSVSDGVAYGLVAVAITTTAIVPIFATQALYRNYETQKPLIVSLSTGTAAMGTQVAQGWVRYVVD